MSSDDQMENADGGLSSADTTGDEDERPADPPSSLQPEPDDPAPIFPPPQLPPIISPEPEPPPVFPPSPEPIPVFPEEPIPLDDGSSTS
jgi:hypothetical protein